MTPTDTIHADHARSVGQIEGVIGALAAVAPDHLAWVQALQISGAPRLWLVHQPPGGDGVPRLVLDVLDGGAVRAALADGSTVMLTC